MVVLPVGNPRRLRRFERGSRSLPARLVCLGLVLQWVTGSWPVQAEQIEQAAARHGGAWERIGGGRGRASDGLGVAEASAAVSGVGQGDLSSAGLGAGERPRRVAFGARGQLAWSDGTGVVLRRQGAVDRVALAGTTALVFDARGALWIASLQGLHSGVNAVSGDLSVGVEGVMIRDGELAEPVREGTLAGAIPRLLHDIVAVGADLERLPGGALVPSLMVEGLTLGGGSNA